MFEVIRSIREQQESLRIASIIVSILNYEQENQKRDNVEIVNISNKTITSDEMCSICLVDIKIGTVVYNLTCNHHYHKKCLQEWIKYKNECALCKKTIPIKNYGQSDGL